MRIGNDGTHYLFALATLIVPCVDPNCCGKAVGRGPCARAARWDTVVHVNLAVTYRLGRSSFHKHIPMVNGEGQDVGYIRASLARRDGDVESGSTRSR